MEKFKENLTKTMLDLSPTQKIWAIMSNKNAHQIACLSKSLNKY